MRDDPRRQRSGSGVARLEASESIDAEIASRKGSGYENGAAKHERKADDLTLAMVLAYDGNIADLIEKSQLDAIGQRVLKEYAIDEASRKTWLESVKTALETAGQEKGDAKNWPFTGAANVKYPLLTTASIQFAARAYPAIVRGDEPAEIKINGQDRDGQKSARAARVSSYTNDQLAYQCKEWESGTDALLHQLPIIGAAFRKVYWDSALKRPRLDYAPAPKVVLPADSPSLDLAPRITHILDTVYPIDYERKVRERVWHACTHQKATDDSQKPMCFLEQCRYEDLDGDGLSEPYIVTVYKDTGEVVRIDPAYDVEDVIYDAPLYLDDDEGMGPDAHAEHEAGESYQDEEEEGQAQPDGRRVLKINRLLPWVDYTFLPDPQGGAYGIGFGKLLEAISETINTLLNQMIDAGTWANTITGIAGSGLHTRSGTITLEPHVIKMIQGLTDPDKAIKLFQHPGPNPVSFSLIELLLTAAKDITSVKDVLTGESPNSGTPATSTLALIEQGLQVFTSIYKRIYRSMTREFELLCRLNARYLDPGDYQKFLDEHPEAPVGAPQMGHNGGPPLTPQDMGAQPPMPPQGPPQAPQQGVPPGIDMMGMQAPMAPPAPPPPNPQADFDLSDMDIRPVADPTAVTEMQRMAKVQFLMQMAANPGAPVNIVEIYKYAFQAARIPDSTKYIMESNPAVQKQAELAEQKAAGEAATAQAQAQLTGAQAVKAQADAQTAMMTVPLKERELQLKEAELIQKDQELRLNAERLEFDIYKTDIEQANRELEAVQAKVAQRDQHEFNLKKLAQDAKKNNPKRTNGGDNERRSN